MRISKGGRIATGCGSSFGRPADQLRHLPASRRARVLTLAILCGILAGCGGGGSTNSTAGSTGNGASSGNGGGSTGTGATGVSMSLSTQTITESAAVGQSAPAAVLQVYANGVTAGQQVYMSAQYSENGIASASDQSGTSPITINLQFRTPASLGAGTYQDTVTVSLCYDQACAQQVTNSPQTVNVQYTVTGSPLKLTALSPSSTTAEGPAFTLSVTGSGFTPQSQLSWNGIPETTTFVSATSLNASIPASDIQNPGTVAVSVIDQTYGASNSLPFTIVPAQLSLSSVSPASVAVGGPAFMLTVLGTGFTSSSVVQWNGTARPTTYVSSSELVAQIGAADIAALGTASVTVQDSTSTIGTTSPQTVTIAPVSVDATGFQMNAAHSGNVTFANLLPLPTAPKWSVDVGGTPSYALIADGKVFVTVPVSGGGSEVLALDQGTGATLWGPILVAGSANAAYDNGRLFVISSPFGNAATMEAFDAGTGAPDWSTLLSGQYAFSSAPSAGDGMVFTGGAGSGGTLYALDEASGALVWTQNVQNGDDSTPAVTADGVYVTYPCWTYDFRPATGETIWSVNTGCEGGGGDTPVVGDQLVYSPENVNGYDGTIYSAETGSSQGTFTGSAPPALTAGMGYFVQGGTLRGITEPASVVQWSFAGDGTLTGAPIVVNQYVFIGSTSGNLYGLDATTGSQVWTQALGAPVDAGVGGLPYSGLAAGDGLLVVPAGTRVIAYTLSTNP